MLFFMRPTLTLNAGQFFMIFLLSVDFIQNELFQKILSGILSDSVSISLDPDQARHSAGPDLGPKLFAKISGRRQNLLLAGKESAYESLVLIAKATAESSHQHTHKICRSVLLESGLQIEVCN